MSAGILALVAGAIFLWSVVSSRLEQADLTAPIVFVAVGVLIANIATWDGTIETETVTFVTEVTLSWVLFSDAAKVDLADLRSQAGIFLRLLAVALPVTVVLGWVLAQAMFPTLDVWLALLIGAALAPTDAALGASLVSNPRVPARIREILNVESGLNDGIVTPVVIVALAGAAATEGHGPGAGEAALQLLAGAAIGALVGAGGGAIMRTARARGWVAAEFAGPAVLVLALLCYTAAVAVGANGFVAAFVGGIAYGHTSGRTGPSTVFYVEQTADLASLVVWTLFGAVAVPIIVDASEWRLTVYAVLSLTAVRMIPVLLTLLGASIPRPDRLVIAWFGPRGLASVVFALLTVEELGSPADPAVAVIATTVLFSVVAHGLSSGPLADRYPAVAAAQ